MTIHLRNGKMRDCLWKLPSPYSTLSLDLNSPTCNQNQILFSFVLIKLTLQNVFGDISSCCIQKSRSLFNFSNVHQTSVSYLYVCWLTAFAIHVIFAPSSICASSLWFSCYARSDQLTYMPPPLGLKSHIFHDVFTD